MVGFDYIRCNMGIEGEVGAGKPTSICNFVFVIFFTELTIISNILQYRGHAFVRTFA